MNESYVIFSFPDFESNPVDIRGEMTFTQNIEQPGYSYRIPTLSRFLFIFISSVAFLSVVSVPIELLLQQLRMNSVSLLTSWTSLPLLRCWNYLLYLITSKSDNTVCLPHYQCQTYTFISACRPSLHHL